MVAFVLRYMDLFIYFVSFYNTFMKVFFIGATLYTIFLLRRIKPYCAVSLSSHLQTYDSRVDDFKHYRYIYPGVFIATLILHTKFSRKPWSDV